MKALQNKLAQELLTAYEAGPPFLAHREIEMYLQAGELLIQQGDEPRNVFIVLEGAVKIYHSTMKSNDYLIAIEGAGEILGEVEILTGVAYSCSVTAVEKTKVAVIKKEQYQQWLKVDHDFALLINSILCDRLQKITKRAATHLSYPLEYSALRLLKLLSLDSQSITLSVSKGKSPTISAQASEA